MAEEKSSAGGRGRQVSKDISAILRGWEYEPGTVNVRKITGSDGQPKLQMRLDLGLLQMELSGRPDGRRPHGFESLLDYHERRLRDYRKKNGTEEGFHLTGSQCQALREEALMYYHRYLSLFVLGEFPGVALDTERNLRVLDLCGKYASDEQDRLVLEQYRPYILMMYSRARASVEFEAGKAMEEGETPAPASEVFRRYRAALVYIKRGLRDLKAFFTRFGQPEAYRHSNEVRILRRFGIEIRKKLPTDPKRELEKKLQRAVRDERYEEAAKLRDELGKLESSHSNPAE
jgi:hypothetical protein